MPPGAMAMTKPRPGGHGGPPAPVWDALDPGRLRTLLQEVVGVHSPSYAEGPATRLFAGALERAGLTVERQPVAAPAGAGPRSNLLVRVGPQPPAMLWVGHVDTIEAALFGPPRTDGDRLHGLGAADCKGGLAAQVFVGALLKRSLLPLKGNLVIAATVGQERGHSVGVRALLQKTLPELKLKPTYAILGEPTGLGLYYGHDGWVEVEIRVEGANPFHVDDAARAILNDFDSTYRETRQTEPCEAVAMGQPQFEDVKGMRAATIRMARRLRMSEDVGDVVSQIKHNASLVAQPNGAFAVEVAVRQQNQKLYTGRTMLVHHVTHAWATDPFHPLVERSRQALAAAGLEARPGRWQLDRLGMGTAGSTLLKDFQVPTIGYGPGTEPAAHACNEFVEVEKVVEAVYGTTAVVHGLVGIPVFGWTMDEV